MICVPAFSYEIGSAAHSRVYEEVEEMVRSKATPWNYVFLEISNDVTFQGRGLTDPIRVSDSQCGLTIFCPISVIFCGNFPC